MVDPTEKMSNRAAIAKCEDIIFALEDCQRQHNFLAKAAGACFDLEKAVRMCRHEARLEDRRNHAAVALEKRKRQEERWRQIEQDEA